MLTFEKGLRIGFWNVKNQRTEGIIQFKTQLAPNSYIVDTVESGSCIVNENQITHVLIKDPNLNNIWV